MTKIRRLTRSLALPAALLCPLVLGVARAEVSWRTDYNKARQEASSKGVPMFIDIGTENCFWCKQLDTRTFKDPAIIALLNERFVPLKVDAERLPFLVQALRIQSYPTLVLSNPEGKIVDFQEGFLEAGPLKERLVKVLAAVSAPDWMVRDFEEAGRAVAAANYARALSLLRGVVEDGKDRSVQVRARKMIEDLEKSAGERCARAKQLAESGRASEALEIISDLVRTYPGTQAVREGKQLQLTLTSRAEDKVAQRARQARELLTQAREDYRAQQFLCCLDRCEALVTQYADRPEAGSARVLAEEIKSNPEWTKKAADQLAERLSLLYLALADAWLKKGQPQQAIFYLERIVRAFPKTQYAETARARLAQLRGSPVRAAPKKEGVEVVR
jgi:thioredoxin-like negative regulator of GroEL